jgi:transposase
VSRQSEKFLNGQSRKFLLTAARLREGANCDEPGGKRLVGLLKAGTGWKMTQREAAERMEVAERWVRKLLRRMKREGDRVVVHGLRGRPSNRKLPQAMRRQALAILKQPEGHDFGPTFASEQLAKRHKMEVSDETLRGWMIEAGRWKSKAQTRMEVHGWRPRRSGLGELVQWDTSEQDWLEGRGPVRYLVRMIDDASSWSWGRFVESDSTVFNRGVLGEYREKNGRMVDVYTDRASMFTVARQPGESEQQRREADRLTQMGRALRELGIDLDSFRRQPVSGDRVLARVERTLRPAGDGVCQSPPGVVGATGTGGILVMSGNGRSATTTPFRSLGGAIKSCVPGYRRECAGSGCAWNSGWTAT